MNNYLLIDEIQMCDEFEKAINGFHATVNKKMRLKKALRKFQENIISKQILITL